MKTWMCEICGKETRVTNGWHLNKGSKTDLLNLCSNNCVADFIEKLYPQITNQEKRITKLEKSALAKNRNG